MRRQDGAKNNWETGRARRSQGGARGEARSIQITLENQHSLLLKTWQGRAPSKTPRARGLQRGK